APSSSSPRKRESIDRNWTPHRRVAGVDGGGAGGARMHPRLSLSMPSNVTPATTDAMPATSTMDSRFRGNDDRRGPTPTLHLLFRRPDQHLVDRDTPRPRHHVRDRVGDVVRVQP